LGLVVAAFIAGTFVAYPELRAFAAATIGSADIIDGSIQSIDIKDAQVKTADLAGSAVTSGKIKDGEIKVSDLNPAFFKKVILHDDTAGNAAGWNPDSDSELIVSDSAVKDTSFVFARVIQEGGTPQSKDCSVTFTRNGTFLIGCNADDGDSLHYIVIN
jgi:hypothetical protein